MTSPRHRAREFAVQGLYQWQLTGHETPEIEAHLMETAGFEKADYGLFTTLFRGTLKEAFELRTDIEPLLDRAFADLSPVERAILLLASFEFKHQLETPYRVVLNEAIELAKSFGGTDGHKYVNGVLDKLAARLRATEVEHFAAQRRAAREG